MALGVCIIAPLSEVKIWHDGCLDGREIPDTLKLGNVVKLTFDRDSDGGLQGLKTSENLADNAVILIEQLDNAKISALMECPLSGIAEIDGTNDHSILDAAIETFDPNQIFLNLTTKTAYGLAIAESFCALLSRRIHLPESCVSELQIILHESIANAILHGNLEVQSAARAAGFDGLEHQYSQIEASLAVPEHAERRIQVAARWTQTELHLSVRNEGPGYSDNHSIHEPGDAPRRGMELIKSLTDRIEIDQDGRRLNMYLTREAEDTEIKNESDESLMIDGPVELELSSCPILIVDDDEMICEFVKMNLLLVGFHNIETVFDGAQALERVKTFDPDLMILDMSMPVLDGFGVLKELRSNPETEELPVLVTTALDTHEGRNEVLRHGASNLISKPIDAEILIQRSQELLERRLLLRELTRYRNRLEHELSAAREMQRQIVPSEEDADAIAAQYGCRITSHYKSSSELGGDFWGIRALDDDRFMIFTADFSGHGVAASLNTFRLDAIIKEIDIPTASPADFLASVNRSLHVLLEPGQFATMLCAIVEPGQNRLVYAGAAAPEPIFGSDELDSIELKDGSGILLGARAGSTYEDREVAFPEGSFMFLFSDALFESADENGAVLDVEGVLDLTKKAVANNTDGRLQYVLEKFYADAVQPLNDDLTAVWLSR